MNYKLTSIILGSALMGAVTMLNAQDKQTLDLLVSKNVITKAEADALVKDSVVVKAKQDSVKGIKLIGRAQVQALTIGVDEYDAGGNEVSSKTVSSFLMRRMFLGMSADMGAGWSATIVADFANSNYIDSATIDKKFEDVGKLTIGYKKVNFGVEENTSSSKLITIERSFATRYFTEGNSGSGVMGLGGRHTGVFWAGEYDDFDYGVSVNNNISNTCKNPTGGDSYMFTANAAYTLDLDDAEIKTGLNFIYGDQMDAKMGNAGTMYGINPYIKGNVLGFDFMTDFMWAEIKNGALNGSSASPMAFNFALEYKFDIGEYGKIAPAFRYSFLDTDGRGTDISDGIRKASDSGALYNAGQSVYLGVNWYIRGNDIKLQAGYEFAQFNDVVTAAGGQGGYGNANAFRAQMQILF